MIIIKLNDFHMIAGHKTVMEILIEKGVDVNSKNNNEETALLIAAEHGYLGHFCIENLVNSLQLIFFRTNQNGGISDWKGC